MKKSAALALASVLVAASASMASARSAMYPGDHLLDYDPVNQAYEWQINGDAGQAAFASTRRATENARTVAPVERQNYGEDAWTKARQDDALEVGSGGN